MALDGTYAGLLASVASWLHRTNLTASIPDFVVLTEARHARDFRLRRQWAEDTIVFPDDTQTMPLPEDFLSFERVQIQDGDVLVYKSPRMLKERNTWLQFVQGAGYPTAYSIEGGNIVLPPGAGGVTLEVAYRTKLPTIVGTTEVQELLRDHPGVYLWACLAEAAPFAMEDDRLGLWETKYAAEKAALIAADLASEHSGSTLRMRAR